MSNTKRPIIRRREQHNLSRKQIAPEALSTLQRLIRAGHTAYLVGGGVRDLLLERQPKDFDISTDASPKQTRRLFRNAFLIGKRFKLVLLNFGQMQIEVSTFRRQPAQDEARDKDRLGALYVAEDNYYGTPQEDALRRDFTVNGLFYDLKTFSVIDYVGGLRDLDRKLLRSIGDPNIRFREDPVRMLRAVRLSERLGFRIHRESLKAIERHYAEIRQASRPRLYEEVLRLFDYRIAEAAFRRLWETKLLSELMPGLHDYIESSGRKKSIFWKYLEVFDRLPDEPAHAEPAMRFAAVLCPIFMAGCEAERKNQAPRPRRSAREIASMLNEIFSGPTNWRPPQNVVQAVERMLAAQPDLDVGDTGEPGSALLRGRYAAQGVQLYALRMEATGGDQERAAQWLQALEEQGRTGAAPRSGGRRRSRPRRGRARATSDVQKGAQPPANEKAGRGRVRTVPGGARA